MNKLLEDAVATVRELPDADQEIAAKFLLHFADPDAQYYRLTDAQVAEVEIAKREVRDGKIATDAEVEAAFRRFDL